METTCVTLRCADVSLLKLEGASVMVVLMSGSSARIDFKEEAAAADAYRKIRDGLSSDMIYEFGESPEPPPAPLKLVPPGGTH